MHITTSSRRSGTVWASCGRFAVGAFLPSMLLGAIAAQPALAVSVTALHHFDSASSSGKQPVTPPLFDAASQKLVGLTQLSGSGTSAADKTAMVYSLSPSAATSFQTYSTQAQGVVSDLARGTDGKFYFTTRNLAQSKNQLMRFSTDTLAVQQVWEATRGSGTWFGAIATLDSGNAIAFSFSQGPDNFPQLYRYEEGATAPTEIKLWMNYLRPNNRYLVSENKPLSVLAADGWLYGVASAGPLAIVSNIDAPSFLYRVRPDGSDYQQIYRPDNASGYPDGNLKFTKLNDDYSVAFTIDSSYWSALVDGGDGWIYGNMFAGSDPAEYSPDTRKPDTLGGIFRFRKEPDASKPAGDLNRHNFEVLHRFGKTADGQDDATDGQAASGPLVIGGDGALYGTTLIGGEHGKGTVFRISLKGANGQPLDKPVYTRVYDFGQQSDGQAKWPVGLSLNASQPRTLYGATAAGGSSDAGTVFSLVLPEALPVLFTKALTATPSSGTAPLSLALSWTADNAGQCQASATRDGQPSDAWSGSKQPSVAEDRITLNDVGTYALRLTCANTEGLEVSSITTVTVSAQPAPQPQPEPSASSGGGGGSLGLLALLPLIGLGLRRRKA